MIDFIPQNTHQYSGIRELSEEILNEAALRCLKPRPKLLSGEDDCPSFSLPEPISFFLQPVRRDSISGVCNSACSTEFANHVLPMFSNPVGVIVAIIYLINKLSAYLFI